MDIYDISQVLREGIAVWPGDPEYRTRWITEIPRGGSSNVSAVDMGVHTGTHIDAPLHLEDTGCDAANVPVDRCIGPARVYSISVQECIRAADLIALDWQGVQRALFKTHSDIPHNGFDSKFIYFKEDAAEFLIQKKVLLVGIDAPSVDALDSVSLPSHRILLDQGTVILEGIQLGNVEPGDYELICLPLKLAGLDGSPVRAILRRQPGRL
jgi:arylformamidase